MKTVQVADSTHHALVQRKLDEGARSLDDVIAAILGLRGRRARLRAAGPALDRLCRRHRVARLRLFGSARAGHDGPDSDTDLIVDFEPGARPGLFGLARLQDDLERLLGSRVDITTEAGLHPRLRDGIIADAEVVWPAGR